VTTPSNWAAADPAMKHWAAHWATIANVSPLGSATRIRNVLSNETSLRANSDTTPLNRGWSP